jgi:hypothetical protein
MQEGKTIEESEEKSKQKVLKALVHFLELT